MPDPSFASKLDDLSRPILGTSEVAVYPSAGQGFSLNEKGAIPIASNAGRWTMEYVSATVDPANIGAEAGTNNTVTIPGLAVNDLCFWVGCDVITGSGQCHWYTRPPVCATAGQITLFQFNSSSAGTVDVSSGTHHFLVIHRFL